MVVKMDTYYGSVASKGIAIGKIYELKKVTNSVKYKGVNDIELEKARFIKAQEIAIEEIDLLYKLALKEIGEEHALIFEVHKMLIKDVEYAEAIIQKIETQSVNAEYAINEVSKTFFNAFDSMEDEFARSRGADIKDVSDRLLHILSNKPQNKLEIHTPCIVVADDLTPSETVQMDKSKILGFVTKKGSVNSHTAILARTMAVPALVGVEIPDGLEGKLAIIDGTKARLVVNPEEEIIREAENISRSEMEENKLLQELKGKESITKYGKKINLYANVASIEDVKFALENDAEGIGLFRSEFIYLEQTDYPSEEMQFDIYKKAVSLMEGKRVIIRTMDIGADKQIDYFNMEKEENPALGYRALRICLVQEEIFRTQLRALLRASSFGKLAIMIPMVISEWEVIKVKEMLIEEEEKLVTQNIAVGKYEFGIMVETPAAALIAEDLAKHVDFFSIGTNDLMQYTTAIDRQNQKLDKFYDAHHPAVMKLIEMVAKAGRENGVWTAICGELGADITLTKTFIDYGIDELSVSPSCLLSIRKVIRELDK